MRAGCLHLWNQDEACLAARKAVKAAAEASDGTGPSQPVAASSDTAAPVPSAATLPAVAAATADEESEDEI